MHPQSSQISEFIMTQVSDDSYNLAVGQPGLDLIPANALNAIIQSIVSTSINPLLYQYPSVEGPVSFRRDLASFLKGTCRYSSTLTPENIRITYGNSHAISLAVQALTTPGDNVIVEEPTYYLSGSILNQSHVKIHGCPATSGLDMVQFEFMARTLKPSLVYVNPIHHNPTGSCLSTSAREVLLRLSQEVPFYILSDEPYVLLSFRDEVDEPDTSLSTTASRIMPPSYDRLICLGSFSKIMAPGLRCGWMSSAQSTLDKIYRNGALVSGGSPSPILVESIRKYIVSGCLEKHIGLIRHELQARADKLVRTLREQFDGDIHFHIPTGGYFVYVTFNRIKDTVLFRDHIDRAEKVKVRFLPASRCSAVPGPPNSSRADSVRLAFSFYTVDELSEAIILLKECYDSYLKILCL